MSKWNMDGAHSEVGFKIKHLVISNVRGYFNKFEGTIDSPDADFTKSAITFSADTASISTNNTMRDDHLKSPEFFDVAQFPTISFKSTSITKKDENNFVVKGDFTMHGMTKEVTLDAVCNGVTVGMDKAKVMSFDVTGTISRQDFGLTWNAPIETGGMVLSDEVKVEINAEFKEVQ